MIGREAYQNPYLLALLHQAVVDPQWTLPSREEIVERYVPYVRDRLAEGHRLRCDGASRAGLVCRSAARALVAQISVGAGASAPDARAELLIDALRIVRAACVSC